MALLGKLLTILHLACSVLAFSIALLFFLHRPDWYSKSPWVAVEQPESGGKKIKYLDRENNLLYTETLDASGRLVSRELPVIDKTQTVSNPAEGIAKQIKYVDRNGQIVYIEDYDGGDRVISKRPGQPVLGPVFARIEKITDSQSRLNMAEQRWATDRQKLDQREKIHLDLQEWYAKQFEKLDNGDGPMQRLVYKDGKLEVDESNGDRTKMEGAKDWAGKDLFSWKFYAKELGDARAFTDRSVNGLGYLIEDERKITESLIDNKETGKKGLRTRVTHEEEKTRQVQAEQKELEGRWANLRMDTELLYKRQEQLKARILELEKLGIATRP